MLSIHEEALRQVNEGHHNFMLRYRAASKTVYGFVEGKDDPSFYRSIIERFIPDDWAVDLIVTGNKRKLFETYDTFNWNRYDLRRITFFADRDTDDFVVAHRRNATNIYYTDGYSIENSITNQEVYFRLLGEAYSVVDAEEQERHALCKHFEDNLLIFEDYLAPIMAQIILWRIEGCKAYHNDLDLGQIFSFRNDVIVPRSAYTDPNALVAKVGEMVGAQVSAPEERQRVESVYRAHNGRPSLVRGKYLLWFFATILNHVHSTIMDRVAAYQRPPKARNPVGPKTVGFAAAPRVRIPASLRAFIDNTYLRYIGEHGVLLQ